MKLLAIDYGTQRIGYAVSDSMGWTADPLEVWTRRGLDQDLDHLAALIAEHEVEALIIGIPNRLDGTPGTAAERASAFAGAVRARFPTIELRTRDEALTTWAADELMRERGVKDTKKWRDAYAAAVILQEELDSLRGPEGSA